MPDSWVTSEDPLGKHAVSLFEMTYNEFKLNEYQAGLVTKSPEKFQKGIRRVITDFISVRADREKVDSQTYVVIEKAHRAVAKEVACLKELFEGIGDANESLVEQLLPKGADGWYAIPRWEKVAATYGQTTERVFDLLQERLGVEFNNKLVGKLNEQHLRRSELTQTMIELLGDQQEDYDILVIPGHFGFRHKGHSALVTRRTFSKNEFGLGIFESGIMLLTHPERLELYKHFWLDCIGDKFSLYGDEDFNRILFFNFPEGKGVELDSDPVDAGVVCACASAFLF